MSERADGQVRPLVVRESDLGVRARIGGGASKDVDRLETFTVPGYDGALAFSRIRDRGAAQRDPAALARVVAFRNGLDARERATLDGVAAWPVGVVAGDDGAVVGCLVPLAAHPFYYVPSDDTGKNKAPQNAKWLVVAPKRARRAGAVAVGERDLVARCTVLARVSLLLELLHRRGMVFGDLSERSVLFGVGDVAEAFVVGCEEAAFAGEGVLQRNSAGWAAPESFGGERDGGVAESGDGESEAAGLGRADRGGFGGLSGFGGKSDASMSSAPSVQTLATDRYKLGLLILRVLAPAGDGLERSRDADRIPSVLDGTGQRMMTRALGDEPGERPSASEWYAYLRGVILENLAAPVIRRVEVSPALVAEGDEVRLEVELSGAQQLTIEMPGRADIRREVGGRVVFERFTARQSGRIGVRAANAHGEVVALSNVVRVLPVPTPGRLPLATPNVPEGLGVQPDLASLEAAMGISMPPTSREAGEGGAPVSPFERVAELRARLDADALPLHDVLRIGVEAERVSRDHGALFPSFEEFLGDYTPPTKGR